MRGREHRIRERSLTACLVAIAASALAGSAVASELSGLFPGRTRSAAAPSGKQLVESAFQNLFAPGYMMSVETVRSTAEGGTERSRFRVFRRTVDGTMRVLTESLEPSSIEGTRVLQVQRGDGMESTYAFVRSLGREPFETSFRLADPFLCTWYEKGTDESAPGVTDDMGGHEILGRRPDAIGGEPVQRVMIRPFIPRGYDRIELAIAERDAVILEYAHYLGADDRTPSLVARASREDMIELDGRVLPSVLRYDDRVAGESVSVTVAHAPLPEDVSDVLFDPLRFHRAETTGLLEQTQP